MEYKLLDHLANVMKVNYLSELKQKENKEEYKEYVQAIDDNAYSLEDWQDTCSYLLGSDTQINTVAEAKACILHWLSL